MGNNKIAIIGMGYVGNAFADLVSLRYELVTYDVKDDKPYPQEEIDNCVMAAVCVPTPMSEDGSCDTSFVREAVAKIQTPLIVIKSTVPPGTTEQLREETGKHIVFSPEYVGESKYINPVYKTMKDTPYIICGGNAEDVKQAFEIFEKVTGPYYTYYSCSSTEAELIKYMANSFMATKVAFINQFYDIAQTLSADWYKVREGWLLDERIGRSSSSVFHDERGFGGKCLPKDISAIVKAAENNGYSAGVLNAVIEYNNKLRT